MTTEPKMLYDSDGDPILSSYRLSLWSAWIRVRDERTCQLCLNNVEEKSTYLQAHHIRPKNSHGELAYSMGNGLALCIKCHLRVTHSDERNVIRFRSMFFSYMNRRYVREFNLRYQHKIGNVYLPTEEDMKKYKISKGWSKLILAPVVGYEQ